MQSGLKLSCMFVFTVALAVTDAASQDLRQEFATAVAQRLNNAELNQELATLTDLPPESRVERLAEFKPHRDDRSRIDHVTKSVEPAGVIAPSDKLRLILRDIGRIQKTSPTQASGLENSFLAKMTIGQAWRVLESLDFHQKFDAAFVLAEILIERETDAESADLLALASARNAYLAYSSKLPTVYQERIERALLSQNEDVSQNARYWKDAVSTPSSYESLLIAQQIWLTEHMDRKDLDASGAHAMKIAPAGQRVYEIESANAGTIEEREARLAKIASITAGAAFQIGRMPVIEWAIEAVEGLTHGDEEDKLAPAYFHAYQQFVLGDYLVAAQEFEKIFLTGIQCDIAAHSGVMLAGCMGHLERETVSLAAFELLADLYPAQTFVIAPALASKTALQERIGDQTAAVDDYIEQNFRPKLERVITLRPDLKAQIEVALNRTR